jgi:transcriptional regulator GlxA family with amidase domain
MAIADVAAAAGFHDQSHLTRQFRALLGTTPGAYRCSGTT